MIATIANGGVADERVHISEHALQFRRLLFKVLRERSAIDKPWTPSCSRGLAPVIVRPCTKPFYLCWDAHTRLIRAKYAQSI